MFRVFYRVGFLILSVVFASFAHAVNPVEQAYLSLKEKVSAVGPYATVISSSLDAGFMSNFNNLDKIKDAFDADVKSYNAIHFEVLNDIINKNKLAVELATKYNPNSPTFDFYKNAINTKSEQLFNDLFVYSKKITEATHISQRAELFSKGIKFVGYVATTLDWAEVAFAGFDWASNIYSGTTTKADYDKFSASVFKATLPPLGLAAAGFDLTGINADIDYYHQSLYSSVKNADYTLQEKINSLAKVARNGEQLTRVHFAEMETVKWQLIRDLEQTDIDTRVYGVFNVLPIVLSGKQEEYSKPHNELKQRMVDLKEMDAALVVLQAYSSGLDIKFAEFLKSERQNVQNIKEMEEAFYAFVAAIEDEQRLQEQKQVEAYLATLPVTYKSYSNNGTWVSTFTPSGELSVVQSLKMLL